MKKGKEIEEEICVERFLNWYNKLHSRHYTYEKATDRFSDLQDKSNWDFVAFERDNPQEWLGIEEKAPPVIIETSKRSKFWKDLCSDLTKRLQSKGIQGRFEISLPPVLDLTGKRQKFLEAFSQVLIDKQPGWRVGETKDIGPDVWSKFPNWPTEKSEPFDEYDKWGTYLPCKLEIKKISDSGCKVSMVIGPLIVGDVPEEEKKAFNEVDIKHANKQLKLAKERGAREAILLLASLGVDEGLTKSFVQNVDRHLISDIGCIYLVNMGDTERVVKMYPD